MSYLYGQVVPKVAVAPMMDWTDRHCRFFHRQLTRHALLYTEMVVADAVIHGERKRLLGYDPIEHPVALQLGGSDPAKLAEAVRIATDFGYDEFNLNVGCPSDRVQSGTFGACLMKTPDLVARCVEAMKEAAPAGIPVTVKCRIGVDEQDPNAALFDLSRLVSDAGTDAIWVHARKAWLEGLSPKENRDVPPLDYEIVYRLKAEYPSLFIGINGGIQDLIQAREHLARVDGAMLGRAAYQNPGLLADADRLIYGETIEMPCMEDVVETMADYVDRHVAAGGRANQVTRHMVGLFHGVAGARQWRQILSTMAVKPGANGDVLRDALRAITDARQNAA
ncbi:tRNA dihydrouridine(20/20a) synthase DusA [Oricola thermophila]|uniref:tRNA-dihydrouridine(20/20a) synthase n=1 Tax=Oricola thermophila TaxID=2742145 RepID=A0A6N1VMU2_9HYPH|nr:tRNA dihydrouridine(20/20a) synthase DusA [Oricola thermophila]QKV20509.1 tRNA dihydrouridine(20/20a) synthase DusA [Oricola thermophila]